MHILVLYFHDFFREIKVMAHYVDFTGFLRKKIVPLLVPTHFLRLRSGAPDDFITYRYIN